MAMRYNPETGQYEQEDDYFSDQAPPPTATDRGWRWELRTPTQSPREGYEWQWQGGWDENGQGWQETPRGGWTAPTNEQVANDVDQNEPNVASPGTWDVGRWNAYGVDTDSIFDRNTGQLRPGWTRTAKGYENSSLYPNGPGSTTPPPKTGGDTGPGPTGGIDPGGYQAPSRPGLAPLNYPSFTAPQFAAPEPFSYDPFSYESFQAPTIEEAQSEPGFEYALNQGVKAYENSKAYLGTYKTGGTIKGLNDYARNMANQNYNQVFERKGQTYDRNRGNAFSAWSGNRENAADAYATNYGISRDVFDRNYTASRDEYQPKARAAELQFGRDWDQYAYEGDDAYRRWKALVDANAT